MHESTPTHWDADGNLEVLTFNLDEETFAMEAVLVQEIVDLLPETIVPGASPLVGSVVNFRGKIIPIADLRLAFGMPQAEPTVDSRIVVIEMDIHGEPTAIGIRTDKVHEVATLTRDHAEEPPAVGMRWKRDFVRELVRAQDGIIVLPDLPSIFRSLSAADDHAGAPASTIH
ncbi:chemotaxis protein CheW [Sphingomonas quercus]|uniref:Chemotaxis protein CheW n=1 Tax=Sphingomonas quercus TaxID=2842451 RepID=A0ABS6BKV0_9SPHN|nr:chemotaxis protein CheW [Sphingomonas quercus]MBU3078051.1 chemotaxis protein CheW [Sphingomonas quercus]